ncbi:MAG: hypothetical protein EVJ46_09925 [Candidatus Acididesulfobacter guangdongensis]|uniref:Uncharacterized protein n=1 Tax=Acididesulfobacter guangdongensis TaxID=2597225 RepID=A0A519BE92_ACIG2|nr:MAG: hypothetical protein EVJ46_09925 [Candidatus Acididesulfobacter guangdongensis]
MKIQNYNEPKLYKIAKEITELILRIPGNKRITFIYGSSIDKTEKANVFLSPEGVFCGSYSEFMAEEGIKRAMPEIVRRNRLAAGDSFRNFLQKVITCAFGNIIISQELGIETDRKGNVRPISQRKIYGIKLYEGNWQPLSKEEAEEIHAQEAEDMKRIGKSSFVYSDLSEFLKK